MPVQAHGHDHSGQVVMGDNERRFIITIRAESDLDVHNVQDALVMEAQRASGSEVDHGNLDVELVDVSHNSQNPEDRSLRAMTYKVLDAA